MHAKTFVIDSPSYYTFNIILWFSCLFTYKPKCKQKTDGNFGCKSYPNDRLHIFSCTLKVTSNIIVNIMKCQKSLIRNLYWLYRPRNLNAFFRATLKLCEFYCHPWIPWVRSSLSSHTVLKLSAVDGIVDIFSLQTITILSVITISVS